ncbi:MAG TPA: diaminopimelate epimerase [Streptosporangiaceae bacterium]|nr:diaminopimelate epimerase [Streptosporangiaceae bacterium]
MRFAKGHGTGNDFLILPDPDGAMAPSPGLVARLCDRHTGLGADGILRAVRVRAAGAAVPHGAAGPAGEAGWFMDYRNADGSVAEMCGNGVRVFARYLLEHGLADGPELALATRAGLRLVRAEPGGEFTVDMGLPAVGGRGTAVIGSQAYDGLVVSLGNPHLACVVNGPVAGFDLTAAPVVDHGQFPDGVNVEVVRLLGERRLEMRVHERGSGETLSCGTGAVAAAVAAARAPNANGHAHPEGAWTVQVPGGTLTVTLSPTTSLLTGPAVIVAEGELDQAWLAAQTAATAVI